MSWKTGLGFALLMTLPSACGSSAEEPRPDGSTTTDGATGDGSADPRLDEYEWSFSSTAITALPDEAPEMNGNLAADLGSALVELEVTLAARPDADAEDEELPITSAAVRIGAGQAGASAENDFEWHELTHRGGGVYSASTTGFEATYRVEIEGPVIGRRVSTLESIPSARIVAPTHGQAHSGNSSLPLEFEPIVSGVWASRLVDGEPHGPATTNATDQQNLSITSTWLHPGTSPEITIHRFRAQFSVGSAGQHGISVGEKRSVTIQVQ